MFKGIEIPRGSFVASLNTISTECGLTIQQVRTAIRNLESTQNLTRFQHGKYTVFTVVNYDLFQEINTICNTKSTRNQHDLQHEINTICNTKSTTIEEVKNKKKKENKKEESAEEKAQYKKVLTLYQMNCFSFPKVKVISEKRKKAIKGRFNQGYTLADFEEVFKMAEQSEFLKSHAKDWACFDWFISDTYMPKILEGRYNHGMQNKDKQEQSENEEYYAGLDSMDWMNERGNHGESG